MGVQSFGNPAASFRGRFGRTGKRAANEVPLPIGLTATGGTTNTYTSGSIKYKTHVFESSATPGFQVTSLATGSFTNTVDVFLVGGGGAGNAPNGGGGGGGGVVYSTSVPVSLTSYPIVVGSGGAALNPSNDNSPVAPSGSDSTGFSLTAGGGGGGGARSGPGRNGASGRSSNGSSGGGGLESLTSSPTPGNGTGGAGGAGGSGADGGGGGGGAGGNGNPSTSASNGSAGGAGIENSILGTSYYWAGGGGGSNLTNPTKPAAGGIGGGGGGGRYEPGANPNGSGGAHGGSAYKSNPLTASNRGDCSLKNAGAENTGGGGGAAGGGTGGETTNVAGNGGKGIVIVRYQISPSQS